MPSIDRRRIVGEQRLRAVVADHPRQIQRECRALAELACHLHLAAGLPGEAEHLRQAEAGALADLLGGVERLEDAAEHVVWNPDPGIGHGHRDMPWILAIWSPAVRGTG